MTHTELRAEVIADLKVRGIAFLVDSYTYRVSTGKDEYWYPLAWLVNRALGDNGVTHADLDSLPVDSPLRAKLEALIL